MYVGKTGCLPMPVLHTYMFLNVYRQHFFIQISDQNLFAGCRYHCIGQKEWRGEITSMSWIPELSIRGGTFDPDTVASSWHDGCCNQTFTVSLTISSKEWLWLTPVDPLHVCVRACQDLRRLKFVQLNTRPSLHARRIPRPSTFSRTSTLDLTEGVSVVWGPRRSMFDSHLQSASLKKSS